MNNKKKNLRYAITATHDLTCKWPRQVPLTPLWPTSVPSGHMCVSLGRWGTPLLPSYQLGQLVPAYRRLSATMPTIPCELGLMRPWWIIPPLTVYLPAAIPFFFFSFAFTFTQSWRVVHLHTATPVPLKRVSRGAESSSDSRR